MCSKLAKVSVAMVMGLLLALSLLTAGVSAQQVNAGHSGVVNHTIVATAAQKATEERQTVRGQQATQPMYRRPGYNRPGYRRPGYYHRHFFFHHRFYNNRRFHRRYGR